MSKKIVIIGALGYLGTELCKIYSGESWYNKIIAIDSRFVSERVNQLGKWNIKFLQGNILDKEFLKRSLNDADVVFHLAGITDVAYVKKESNSEKDENIKKIAIDGTNNVLNSISQKCLRNSRISQNFLRNTVFRKNNLFGADPSGGSKHSRGQE